MENRIKNKILNLIFFTLIISLIIISLYLLVNNTNIIFQNTLNDEQLIETIDLAVEQNDTLVCDEIRNTQQRDYCYENFNFAIVLEEALVNEDINICQGTTNSQYQQMCNDRVFKQIALNQEDTSYCENINSPYLRERCFNQ